MRWFSSNVLMNLNVFQNMSPKARKISLWWELGHHTKIFFQMTFNGKWLQQQEMSRMSFVEKNMGHVNGSSHQTIERSKHTILRIFKNRNNFEIK